MKKLDLNKSAKFLARQGAAAFVAEAKAQGHSPAQIANVRERIALAAIEIANNAYVISNAFGVITFAATKFSAAGVARKGFIVVLVKEAIVDGINEPDPHVFTIAI